MKREVVGKKAQEERVHGDYVKTVNSVYQNHHIDFYSQVTSYLVKNVRRGFVKRKPHEKDIHFFGLCYDCAAKRINT